MGRAQQLSRRSVASTRRAGASRTTVLLALAANVVIAITKLAGGLVSGSTALLAEAAHSVADSTNQAFLLTSISLAQREPDEERPFGHGRQRYLWTFLAAVSMFVAGAVFAIGYGVIELVSGAEGEGGFLVAWITLAIAIVAEGASWLRALHQTRREAREAGKPLRLYLSESRDPNVKMVLFEDTAALLGIGIAAAGIALHQLTGDAFWDPAASLVVGALLIVVAVWMAHDTGELLVGASARPDERAAIERALEAHPDVAQVKELLTMVLAPNALLVAARIDFVEDIDADRVERSTSELADAVRADVPDVTEVFLDPTPARGETAAA